jgi:hypothetical protein
MIEMASLAIMVIWAAWKLMTFLVKRWEVFVWNHTVHEVELGDVMLQAHLRRSYRLSQRRKWEARKAWLNQLDERMAFERERMERLRPYLSEIKFKDEVEWKSIKEC